MPIHPLTFGHVALALVPGAGAALKQTLLALRGGVHPAERDGPGAATLQVLQGRVRLVTSEESWALGQDDHLQIPPTRHRLESVEGAAVPLTVAPRQIQLRETPGNLSGSGSETHQHFGQPMQIAASRCDAR